MTEPFNPYHKWLGISPQEQPPHHYRLLGIELFESDPDVIANAADGRMAQIKTFQSGQYSDWSQRLLNEIAAAKICLLSPAAKTEYDGRLRQQQPKTSEPDAPTVPPPPIPAFPPMRIATHLARRRKPSRWVVPVTVAAASMVIALFVVWTNRNIDREPSGPVARQTQTELLPEPPNTDTPESQPQEPVPTEPTPQPEEPADAAPPAKPSPLGREWTDLLADAADALPEVERPWPDNADAHTAIIAPRPPKPAVPDAASQQAAEATIRQVFAAELADAKTPDGKLELATKLLTHAFSDTQDPVARFVLLRTASELAAAAGDPTAALKIVDKMCWNYDFDGWDAKIDALNRAWETKRPTDHDASQLAVLLEAARQLADEAVTADHFDTANRAGKLSATIARATGDSGLIRDIAARNRDIDRLTIRFAVVKKALDALATDPANAPSNLTAGQWYGPVKGDWQRALPLLARGGDLPLADLARRDLAQPTDAEQQTALADAWWTFSEKQPEYTKHILQARAAHWYEQAVERLSGLERTRVGKRIDALAASASEQPATSAARRGGVVQKGNVALAANGATVEGVAGNATRLLDGSVAKDDINKGAAAYGNYPCTWTITLDKVYRLQCIRLLLWNKDSKRYYNYAVAVSPDGENYEPLVNRAVGQWRGWQNIVFPPRPIKSIKLFGLDDSTDKSFCVVEFEAYCLIPMPPQRQR